MHCVFAQGEGNIWYFGHNAGLDFNNGSPVSLSDGMLFTSEGCASIADANGNLLFYTDGVNVWNKLHLEMTNGNALSGNESSTQSAIIVPKPGTSNIYYIFTIEAAETGLTNGLRYSEVDMNADGGLGAITSVKNIQLITPAYEKLTATAHANGTDIWVICHKGGSDDFYSYLITASGVNHTPVISNTGIILSSDLSHTIGYMKASPDGRHLALAHTHLFKLESFDFDNTSGIVSNPVIISQNFQPYGLEFSPSSQLLYAGDHYGFNIRQYNINATEISLSEIVLESVLPLSYSGALQMGPDKKIYVGFENSQTLGIINNPDNTDIECNYNSTLKIDGLCTIGLPQIFEFYYSGSESVLTIPNVFSPGNDDANELFMPIKEENINSLNTSIYNRWGDLIFSSEKLTIEWDGKQANGTLASAGIYFWIANYKDIQGKDLSQKGFLTLIR